MLSNPLALKASPAAPRHMAESLLATGRRPGGIGFVLKLKQEFRI